ncbi:OsmC family protein [Tenuifilum thalassicum]|uniref:OsmC family protein n=1 Tax=Tenuifilum thalassicum TaxID=2590900 RepID=A0A7D3Y3G8_9BACT|nr:OsmC family protein [Tenuifilum thalassicum]QKG79369.1 OsmC family protein [Tenuifilum thalassicum]
MGKTSTIIYKGDLRTEATHTRSGVTITTDAPVDNQGKGECFSPTDLLATSLGACMITIMGIAAQTHGFNIDGTKIDVEKIMGTNPRRVVEVVIDLYFPHNNYTEKERKLIAAAANECPVAQSLHPDLKQTFRFHFPE